MTPDSPTQSRPPSPWRAAAILGAAAQLLFSIRIAVPHKLVFDEVHYVPAARKLLTLGGPANIEHPLVAKELIAAGILLFGDNSLGWRFFSSLAGTATVLAMFAIAWLIFGRLRTAVLTALFVLLNITVFIQARIAMLDGFMAAFTMLGIAALLWSMRAETARQSWVRWVLGAVLLGLAVGAKWAAAPFVAYAAIGFVWLRLRDARVAGRSIYGALNGADQRHWPGLAAIPATLALGIVSVATYAASFAPAFFYKTQALTLHGFVAFQQRMYFEQTQVLPHHPYQSDWWTWPLIIRPIWYLYEPADGAIRGIFLVGNPAIFWGGLIGVLACLWAWWRGGSIKLLAAAGLWIGAYAMWIVIPKSLGFFYYYYIPSIVIALPLAAAWQHYGTGRLRRADEWFVALAAALFAYFYPIIAAVALAGPQSFLRWIWFSTWP